MDAMISDTDEEEPPVSYNHVAGVVVTGNEDGAHHVISEISGALGDIGFTIPGRSRRRPPKNERTWASSRRGLIERMVQASTDSPVRAVVDEQMLSGLSDLARRVVKPKARTWNGTLEQTSRSRCLRNLTTLRLFAKR
jgi:hypothetical protein